MCLAHALVDVDCRRADWVQPDLDAGGCSPQSLWEVLMGLVDGHGESCVGAPPVCPKVAVKALHKVLVGLIEQRLRGQGELQRALRLLDPRAIVAFSQRQAGCCRR